MTLATVAMEERMAQVPTTNENNNDQQMITVSTSRFGEIQVSNDKVITMASPFLGFPESKHFVLRPHSEDSPFMWLQSLDDPNLAFVVIQAALLVPQYTPSIPNATRQELADEGASELDTLLLLTIPRDNPQKMTANLLGPLFVNPAKRIAKQVLLDPTVYDACWPVFTSDAAE